MPFNIFAVLAWQEEVHSKFLAEVLNPNGLHGQGHLFIETLLKRSPLNISHETLTLGRGHWEVETEDPFANTECAGRGFLDIRLSNRRIRHLIIIENKITTEDSYAQLRKYWDYMENHEYIKSSSGVGRLVYLTSDGRMPRYFLDPKPTPGLDSVQMSYQTDIPSWLKESIEHVNDERTIEIINQYVKVIEVISAQGHWRRCDSDKIVELIAQKDFFDKMSNNLETRLQENEYHMKWGIQKTTTTGFAPKELRIRSVEIRPRADRQFLSFNLVRLSDKFLYYGLAWNQEYICGTNLSGKAKELLNKLLDIGFVQHDWWLAAKSPGLSILDSHKHAEIEQQFWDFFTEYEKDITDLNLEIYNNV